MRKNFNIFDKSNLVCYIAGSMLFLVPILYAPYFFDPALSLKTFFLNISLLILLIFCFFSNTSSKRSVLNLNISICIILFFLVNLVSVFWAINKYDSILSLSRLYLCILVFFIIVNFINREDIVQLLYVTSISIGICSILGIFQAFGLDLSFFSSIVGSSSTFGNRNIASSVMVLTIPFTLILFIIEKRKLRESILIISFATQAIFLLCARTRSAWVGLIGALVLLVVFTIINKDRFKLFTELKDNYFTRRKLKLVLFVMSIIVVFSFKPNFYEISTELSQEYQTVESNSYKRSILSTFKSISEAKDPSIKLRIMLWSNTLKLVSDNIIKGIGLGNWHVVYPDYAKGNNVLKSTFLRRPHNDFIWILSEIGLFGLLLYISIFIIVIIMCSRIIISNESIEDKIIIIALTLGIISFQIDSFFNFARERITPNMLLWTLVAFITLYYDYRISSKKQPLLNIKINNQPLKHCLSAFFLLITILSLLISGQYLFLDYKFKQQLVKYNNSDWNGIISNSPKQTMFSNYYTDHYYMDGLAYYYIGDYQKSIDSYHKVILLNPYYYYVHYNLAITFEQNNDLYNSINSLQSTIKIKPNYLGALLKLGELYYLQKDYLNSKTSYLSAVKYYPKNHIALNGVGVVSMVLKEYEYAQTYFDQAIIINNDYADAYLNSGINNYYNLNRKQKALHCFEKYLKINPDSKNKNEIYRIIETLNK